METFAVYWEPIIKTYGISERTGLCLVTLDLPGRISDGADRLTHIASQFGSSLVLIFSRPVSQSGMRLHLLLDRALEKDKRVEKDDAIEKKARPEQPQDVNLALFDGIGSGLRVDNPVELVYFQGPHYGDRYGIASAAMTALAEKKVPLLAVVCTGASVYIITPTGKALEARKALGQAFSASQTGKSESET